jgi:hypothetical protein
MTDPYERYEISFAQVSETLAELPLAIATRITREKHSELVSVHHGLPSFLRLITRIGAATFDSVKYLCADRPADPARRIDFAVAVSPLSRTLVDATCNLILIFDNPKQNMRWYHAAGWRSESEHIADIAERYAGDPAWDEWLVRYRARLAEVEEDAGITAAERANPKLISYWPRLGRVLTSQRRADDTTLMDPTRREFLEFLDARHYGRLSSDAHLSPFGVVRRGWLLTDKKQRDATWDDLTLLYKSQVFANATTLYLAFLSELIMELNFEHEKTRIRTLWKHILRWPEAQDIVSKRYGKLLGFETDATGAG